MNRYNQDRIMGNYREVKNQMDNAIMGDPQNEQEIIKIFNPVLIYHAQKYIELDRKEIVFEGVLEKTKSREVENNQELN
jgi:hypothetical protein